ncbi:MAG: radical SAM family heme chaperone HemW [Methylococcaceae bacterium]|nr:radical SAM family heme chaperone HemW [Methylococcaceae bacterium]
MKTALPPLSLYIHIPWCIQKCPYCDFNSHAAKGELPESRYISTLLEDLRRDIERFEIDREINSIFIGGGTPSLFSSDSIATLLAGVAEQLPLKKNAEITLEANPSTFESDKFKEFKEAGINRLSIGVQSFHNEHLKKLGRIHNATEAFKAAEIAHCVGFDNFNLDLMFGLPQQTKQQALADIKNAIALAPSHISFYQLTLEPNTYFHKFPPALPKDELIFSIQQHCQQLLRQDEFKQYEVSAYAKAGSQCQHNLNYWQFGDYLGIGAGAHGKISLAVPNKIYRTAKAKNPQTYLAMTDSITEQIKPEEIPLEFMMNQLRLRQGFSINHYQKVTGLQAASLEPALSSAVANGLLTHQQSRFFCSEKGWNFLDSVLGKFII